MTKQTSIELRNVGVDFPVFNASALSLKNCVLSRNDAEPLTTDFTDDTDAKHLDEGPETVKKVHHLVSNPPAGIVLKFL